ncbi:MAG: dethiobiotin synthase [Pseudomonadota bacterium]
MTTRAFIITGTDTGIGKTVFAAALTQALSGTYWKPIQAGISDGTDSQEVARLTDNTSVTVAPEVYCLTTPCSPHQAAAIDNKSISLENILAGHPKTDAPLIIEGAGGLLVPLSDTTLQIELFAQLKQPLIICARTALGTINHSLLTVQAAKARNLDIAGIAFIGEENVETERVITHFAQVPRLGRLPHISDLKPTKLAEAFHQGFATWLDTVSTQTAKSQ